MCTGWKAICWSGESFCNGEIYQVHSKAECGHGVAPHGPHSAFGMFFENINGAYGIRPYASLHSLETDCYYILLVEKSQ